MKPAIMKDGDRFGRFRLLERIGQGGMAEVFRATRADRTAGDGPAFVIKRIRPDRSDAPEFVRMFCDEARITALLHHPNIVRIYDFGQIDGAYFMAMEYLAGQDLAAVLRALRSRRAALPPPLAAFVAREAARALAHAHTAVAPGGEPGGVVHRDVSPSNVMLLSSGGVKVLDFGIAKAAAQARATETGSAAPPKLQGHLGYLSPEQIRGVTVDHRSDLFSLGVLLWEMLAGRSLFAGKDEFETMRNVLRRAVPPVSRRGTRVPEELAEILGRALERDPARRYQTASEMAEDLDRFLVREPCPDGAVTSLLTALFGDEAVGEPVSGGRSAAEARPRLRRPRARPAAAVAAVVAGLALGLSLAWLARGAAGRSTDQSSSARSVSTSR